MRRAINIVFVLLLLVSLLFSAGACGTVPTSGTATTEAVTNESAGKQEGIKILYEKASYTFAEELAFEIAIDSKLKEANLLYQVEGEDIPFTRQKEIIEGAARETLLQIEDIPPAAEISYFWELEDINGHFLRTDEKSFLYLDQRFDWQNRRRNNVTVFWYYRSKRPATDLFDQLPHSFDQISRRLRLTRKEPIKIVIYLSREDTVPVVGTRKACLLVGKAWPEQNIILSFRTKQWEDTLTHELTHLLVYQNYQLMEDDVPLWLDEGLATYVAQGPLGPPTTNPLPISALNSNLINIKQIELVYLQSQSLVTFLVEEKGGKEKINKLLTTMAEGETVDNALLATYGFDHHGLEKEWREWIGKPLPEEEIEIPKPKGLPIPIVPIAVGTICLLVIVILLFVIIIRRER